LIKNLLNLGSEKKNKIASCEGCQQAPIEHNKRTLMNTNITQKKNINEQQHDTTMRCRGAPIEHNK
jgi:hypothetical protein